MDPRTPRPLRPRRRPAAARPGRTLVAGLVLAAGLLSAAPPAGAASWRFETLDGTGPTALGGTGNVVGGAPGTAVLYGGFPHVFFADTTAGDLRHGWWTGAGWRFEIIDGGPGAVALGATNANVGAQVSALDFVGQLNLFYADLSNGDLRRAYWDGARWRAEPLDGTVNDANGRTAAPVADAGTAVVQFRGGPHVFYGSAATGDLRHAWWTGSGWYFEILDGAPAARAAGARPANVHVRPSALLHQGLPQVFSYDATAGDLRYLYFDGQRWSASTLDGEGGAGGRVNGDVGAQLASVSYLGAPHVFYRDTSASDLRHLWWTGSQWRAETLDGGPGAVAGGAIGGDVGVDPAVGLYQGQPHVYSYDAGNGDLRHAWWTGTRWYAETLDAANDVGRFPSVVSYRFEPHVFFFDATNGDLRHAWFA